MSYARNSLSLIVICIFGGYKKTPFAGVSLSSFDTQVQSTVIDLFTMAKFAVFVLAAVFVAATHAKVRF